MRQGKIIIIDDEIDMLDACRESLEKFNFSVTTENNVKTALQKISEQEYDLAILDIKMPDMDGITLFEKIKNVSPDTVVIFITGFPTVESALSAMKLGAYDYIIKPFSPEQLRIAVGRAIEQKRLKEENVFLLRHLGKSYKFENIIYTSSSIQKVLEFVKQVAPTNVEVLILGESGVGKELVARAIHTKSGRGRFVPVDCGAIPENLLESELFGYEKGAFTGATSFRVGLLEFANNGTLFLDEVCELPLSLQAKLLRVLAEHSFRRVGGTEEVKVDIRLIAATNRNIDEEVKEKRFREDLFYRISAFKISVPPLRERKEDIEILLQHFIGYYAKEMGKTIRGIMEDAKEVLLNYNWPGNVRELQNVVKRAVVLTQKEYIRIEDIADYVVQNVNMQEECGFFALRNKKISEWEYEYLRNLLARHKGDVTEVAINAKLPRGTLYRILKKHNLDPNQFR